MAGLTLDALFKTIEETIESRELDNLKPEIIKRKLLQLSELQTALNKRTVGQVSNEALRRNISEIKEKIIKCEDELWLSFSDDYCLYGDFSDIISIPSTFTAPRAESTLPNPQDESLMIFGLLDELDARSMKLRLYRHLSQLANEHATQHGALHNWAVRLAVFNRRNSALNRINKQLQRVKRKVKLISRVKCSTDSIVVIVFESH
jgi:transcription initiation factor TFIIIB Brf1 subunit/transcription initiation factor TFIIB